MLLEIGHQISDFFLVIGKSFEFVVLEVSFDGHVGVLEELVAGLLALCLVELGEMSLDLFDFVLELVQEFLLYVTNRFFFEFFHTLLFGVAVDIFEFVVEERGFVVELLGEAVLEEFDGVVKSFLALVLADVGPGTVDVGHDTGVDGFNVVFN